MGLEKELEEKGWVRIHGTVRVDNTRTGAWERYDRDTRLMSPDNRAVYRPQTGKLTYFSSDERVMIEQD